MTRFSCLPNYSDFHFRHRFTRRKVNNCGGNLFEEVDSEINPSSSSDLYSRLINIKLCYQVETTQLKWFVVCEYIYTHVLGAPQINRRGDISDSIMRLKCCLILRTEKLYFFTLNRRIML